MRTSLSVRRCHFSLNPTIISVFLLILGRAVSIFILREANANVGQITNKTYRIVFVIFYFLLSFSIS